MVEMYAEELGSTGKVSIGVFQTLSEGNIWHPEMTGAAARAMDGIVRAITIIVARISNIEGTLEACGSFGIGLSSMGDG
jgi:hypothetical protein